MPNNETHPLTAPLYLTDSGLETTLVFHHGMDLPCFAAFPLLDDDHALGIVLDYYRRHAAIARKVDCGFILEAPTWRANRDWGLQLGYTPRSLADANRRWIGILVELREEYIAPNTPILVSGCIGPRGDGYRIESRMSRAESAAYHAEQIAAFADAGADLVSAMTICCSDEAAGIVEAARAVHLPAVISFTTETDGRLPSGETLGDAIESVDRATGIGPAYYMINCAHTDHFRDALADGASWVERIQGLRANASRLSHAELDEADQLDDGCPGEFGLEYSDLVTRFPGLRVLGGCCGTDHRHIEAVSRHCVPRAA